MASDRRISCSASWSIPSMRTSVGLGEGERLRWRVSETSATASMRPWKSKMRRMEMLLRVEWSRASALFPPPIDAAAAALVGLERAATKFSGENVVK